ncbi:ABC transporter permease [Sinirhodobacter populi]|uniref:ABC transporter permease n=1 Tax=Paenirhodobacter populi TaxID=2306993 RepID=A0A443KNY3_9RHOB|nr:ABC transporter permease [Sinirhodobacter populi]RWR34571.1 ABC transporter permease [Sinirhodobacter populi]
MNLKHQLGGLVLPLGLLAVLLAALAAREPAFLSTQNIYALLQSFALLGLVALGLSMCMIAGEFDLGVGSMVAVGGLLTLLAGGQSLVLGLLVAVSFGAIVGAANAFLVRWLNVSSLVVTVGSMMALSGFAFWLAGGRVISTDNFDPGFLLDDTVAGVFSLRSLISFGFFALVGGMMAWTRIGRDIRVTGSRRAVAVASGARVGTSLFIVFMLSGGCAALAGGLLSMSLASASATTGGSLMIQAVSAAIIGGVALSGGAGGPFGVLIGTLVLVTMNNGLSLMGMGASGISFANGIVLMAVVLLDGRAGATLREALRRRNAAIPAE